ncbi:MAG: hypothetical protein VW710_08400, partial [Flavobacteriaceae bacterium]
AQIQLEANGNLLFICEGKDLDEDIQAYSLYLGVTADDLELKKENLTSPQVSFTLESGRTYFWQIKTLDSEGNRSLSQIYRFETIN